MLERGSLESLISRTTFVRLRKAGSKRVNFIMCPGNHDGGVGSGGRYANGIIFHKEMDNDDNQYSTFIDSPK
jgi:hypothetical protein